MDQEVIPGHILNLMCAIHLRQGHRYKGWTIARFRDHFPGLCTRDGGAGFTAYTSCTTPGSAASC
jgi:hypothetical protein